MRVLTFVILAVALLILGAAMPVASKAGYCDLYAHDDELKSFSFSLQQPGQFLAHGELRNRDNQVCFVGLNKLLVGANDRERAGIVTLGDLRRNGAGQSVFSYLELGSDGVVDLNPRAYDDEGIDGEFEPTSLPVADADHLIIDLELGSLYLMRIRGDDGKRDFMVKFRVTSFQPDDHVTLKYEVLCD